MSTEKEKNICTDYFLKKDGDWVSGQPRSMQNHVLSINNHC